MPSEKDLVKLSVFLGVSYASGRVVELLRVSPIIGFVAVGALLGPPLADFVPVVDGVTLAGLLGIQLSVIDAGLGTEVRDVRRSAGRALLVAVLGVIFPIAGTCLVLVSTDLIEGKYETGRTLKSAFAAGAAIAPTSLGVTARLLGDAGELETPVGVLVSIAAVFDDVISLVLLSQVEAVGGDDPGTWELSRPVVFSVLFMVGSVTVALLLAKVIATCLKKLRIPQRLFPFVGLWLLLSLATVATYAAAAAKTSFLLAGYLTGVAFATVPVEIAKQPWDRSVAVHIEWLSMLFFAATIGFVIPLRNLFSTSSLGLGALLGVVGIFGKLFCGLGLLPNWVDGVAVGVAMLGRGEFGFLIASRARAVGLLNERIYAATTWGVLLPTLLTPLIFDSAFRWRKKRQGDIERSNGNLPSSNSGRDGTTPPTDHGTPVLDGRSLDNDIRDSVSQGMLQHSEAMETEVR